MIAGSDKFVRDWSKSVGFITHTFCTVGGKLFYFHELLPI